MGEPIVRRRLAAILSADVKGYSRLMEDDEVDTIRTLMQYRERMAKHIQQHHGRVVDATGDNLLSEFASVVEAVQCAIDIQQELQQENDALPKHRKMEFRMGINLGDVVAEEDRIYGDGVNIAARLEGLAQPGGICLSNSAYEQVRHKLPVGFEYLGERAMKNLAEPVRAYRILLHPGAAGSLRYQDKRDDPGHKRRMHLIAALVIILLAAIVVVWAVHTPAHKTSAKKIGAHLLRPKLPDKPSVAVLPFSNMSEEPDQNYFSDGMTDDLITDLSKISGLFVISRNSVFAYKDKNVKIQDIGRELGVRYVLEGSVRKSGDQVRINAQLIDTTTGGHVWAERYDRDLKELFSVQDEVRKKIVTALAVQLTQDDQARLVSVRSKNLEAYDFFLRGLELYAHKINEGLGQSMDMFRKAIELDPAYAAAYAMLGHAYLSQWMLGWTDDRTTIDQAYLLALKAIEINDLDASGHGLLSNVFLWRKQHDQAIEQSERAVALDPNNSVWMVGLGEQLAWAGQPDRAIELIEKAMRLDPKYPAWYLWQLGHAYFLKEEYATAVDGFMRAITMDDTFWPSHVFLALSYSRLGEQEKAKAEIARVLTMNPQLTAEKWQKRLPYKDPRVTMSIIETIRELGIQ